MIPGLKPLIIPLVSAAAIGLALLHGGCARPLQNGESIFLTGKNIAGKIIQNDIDRTALRDPSIQIACASCHGENRTGRKNPIPDLGPFAAPDITRASLSSANARRAAYTPESLRGALLVGRNPSGKGLHYPMPKWKLDSRDLDDLVDYLLPQSD